MKKVGYARRNTASDFYTKHGMSQFKVESHLNGIDYNRPVIVSQIPPKVQIRLLYINIEDCRIVVINI